MFRQERGSHYGQPVLHPPQAGLRWLSVSADGSKLVAVTTMRTGGGTAGKTYTSADSGSRLDNKPHPHPDRYGVPLNTYFPSIAASADGTKLVAAVPDSSIYTSTNSGASWTTNQVLSLNWSSVASSADGCRLVVVSLDGAIFTCGTNLTPTLGITQYGGNRIIWWPSPSAGFGHATRIPI